MGWGFLAASVVGIALTLNAWRPLRAPAPVALVSFFAGWLTTELALHHLAWQALVVAVAIGVGAITSWVGALAVLGAIASCVGLALLHARGDRAARSFDEALRRALGDGFESRLEREASAWVGPAFAWRKILLPFALGHRDVVTTWNVPFARVGGSTLKLDVHRPRDAKPGD